VRKKLSAVSSQLSAKEVTMPAKLSVYEEQLVREVRGMPEEYLPNLIRIVRLFRESVELKPAEASFRQGWKEALAGETRPVTELWKGVDAE
jgi:hypothetical protein